MMGGTRKEKHPLTFSLVSHTKYLFLVSAAGVGPKRRPKLAGAKGSKNTAGVLPPLLARVGDTVQVIIVCRAL